MRKVKAMILLLVILVAFGGCLATNPDEYLGNDEAKLNSIYEFETAVKDLGIKFTKDTCFYEMVGAKDGYKLTASDNGAVLELYAFDPSSDDYSAAQLTGRLTISSMDHSFDAVVANGYAIVMEEAFPQRAEVYELFYTLQSEEIPAE